MIAQDQVDIYIVVASFKAQYVDYITGMKPVPGPDEKVAALTDDDFMTMTEHGPLHMNDPAQMQIFGSFIMWLMQSNVEQRPPSPPPAPTKPPAKAPGGPLSA